VHDFLDAIKLLDNHFDISNDVYDAVRADPVKRCRELVAAIRLTSQRREEFRKTLADARRNGTFDGDQLELLRDMTVRWSSTYNMINRFLTVSGVRTTYYVIFSAYLRLLGRRPVSRTTKQSRLATQPWNGRNTPQTPR
jgi:hypothetical protein